eukprot:m51a1_g14314 hypothetical protein (716) ;mRNA; r:1829-4875
MDDVLLRPTLTLYGHTSEVTCCVFSPDGTALATSSDDRTLRLWRTGDGCCLASLLGHTDTVWCCAFSPDGATLASASADGTARLWSTDTATCRAVYSCAYSPDGKALATTSLDRSARLWDTAAGTSEILGRRSFIELTCCFSPDGQVVAVGADSKAVRLWRVADHQLLAMLVGHSKSVGCVVFSPDGAALATASDDSTVMLWRADTGDCTATLSGHTGAVNCCVYSPDGATIASGADDNTVRLWRVSDSTCTAVLRGHTNWAKRRVIFNHNIHAIKVLQAEQSDATFAINEFADLSDEEFAARYLTSFDTNDTNGTLGDLPLPLGDAVLSRRQLPATYSSPYATKTPVRHQGSCGSCWAFATSGIVEAAWAKAGGSVVPLSPQQLLDCTAGTCKAGATYPKPLEYARKLSASMGGLMAERDYAYAAVDRTTCGYQAYRAAAAITRWGGTPGLDEALAMPAALVAHGALGVALNSATLKFYAGGVLAPTAACMAANPDHAVLITGYDRASFFRIKKGANACRIAQVGGFWAESPKCAATSGGACAYPLEVGSDGYWGDWGELASCPAGAFAVGFVTKSEESQGVGDDSALNGVRLTCEGGSAAEGPTSLVAKWGTWDAPVACPAGYYVGAFQVLAEKPCGDFCDDTAANALRVRCRNRAGQELAETEYHTMTSWGEWSQWYSCPAGTAVTGIRTRVEEAGSDATALNAIRLRCSPF